MHLSESWLEKGRFLPSPPPPYLASNDDSHLLNASFTCALTPSTCIEDMFEASPGTSGDIPPLKSLTQYPRDLHYGCESSDGTSAQRFRFSRRIPCVVFSSSNLYTGEDICRICSSTSGARETSPCQVGLSEDRQEGLDAFLDLTCLQYPTGAVSRIQA